MARRVEKVSSSLDNFPLPERQPGIVFFHPIGRYFTQLLLALGLTAREAEVLYWITEGKTNPEIAIILDASPDAVKKHATNLYAKLGVPTRTSAARCALSVRLARA